MKVTLDITMPENTSEDELNDMLNWLFYGHVTKQETIERFDHGLSVESFEIHQLVKAKTIPTPFITCPKCRKPSYCLGDIQHQYCNTCGFHSEL